MRDAPQGLVWITPRDHRDRERRMALWALVSSTRAYFMVGGGFWGAVKPRVCVRAYAGAFSLCPGTVNVGREGACVRACVRFLFLAALFLTCRVSAFAPAPVASNCAILLHASTSSRQHAALTLAFNEDKSDTVLTLTYKGKGKVGVLVNRVKVIDRARSRARRGLAPHDFALRVWLQVAPETPVKLNDKDTVLFEAGEEFVCVP
jgi:hypothetical protein